MKNPEVASAEILLAAGNGDQRAMLNRQLVQLGHVVTMATSTQQVLARLEQQPFDLMILCAKLSDGAGHHVLSELLEADRPAVPALVVAAPGETEVIAQALRLGAMDYLFLPTTLPLLATRLYALLERTRLSAHHGGDGGNETLLKIEHDLQIARRIQAGFLPEQLPQVEGWEISARFQPAREVAGDFYDAFMLSQGRRIGFVIADVVDKGVPAALFMALIRSLTRAFAQQNYSLAWTDVLGDQPKQGKQREQGRRIPSTGTVALHNAVLLTNNYVIDNHLQDNMFATLFFGMINPSSGELTYINAGHNPPYIVSERGEIKHALTRTGPAVGMLPGVDFNIEYAELEPGDILYAFTDGVTEARNPTGEFFMEARLESLLKTPAASAGDLVDRVEGALREFQADAEQADDITMLAVRRGIA